MTSPAPTSSASAKPASRALVLLCACASWLASVAWTEFREWEGRQTSERTAVIGQFGAFGVEFNSLALKFNIKVFRENRADEMR